MMSAESVRPKNNQDKVVYNQLITLMQGTYVLIKIYKTVPRFVFSLIKVSYYFTFSVSAERAKFKIVKTAS